MKNHPLEASFGAHQARLRAFLLNPSLNIQPRWNAFLKLTPIHFSLVRWLRMTSLVMISTAIALALLTPATAKANSEQSAGIQLIVDSINQIRSNHGLATLVPNENLRVAAQNHTIDMVTNRNHSHTGTDGSTVRIRVERAGYGSNWSGENWVALTDPAKAIEWWMNSPPHRANILNSSWREIGVGSGTNPAIGLHYFVVVFAARGDGSMAPAVLANPQPAVPPATLASTNIPQSHLVQSGETLSSIATRYGLSWQSIATINNLGEHSILSIGQTVRLPSGSAVGGPAVVEQTVAYTVLAGDTLIAIANRFDTTWEQIALYNNLSSGAVLNINQILQVPVDPASVAEEVMAQVAAAESALPMEHIVQPGETIITIALQYNLNWKTLLSLNSMNDSSLLTVGQAVRLK